MWWVITLMMLATDLLAWKAGDCKDRDPFAIAPPRQPVTLTLKMLRERYPQLREASDADVVFIVHCILKPDTAVDTVATELGVTLSANQKVTHSCKDDRSTR
jgi:hypothetical protein